MNIRAATSPQILRRDPAMSRLVAAVSVLLLLGGVLFGLAFSGTWGSFSTAIFGAGPNMGVRHSVVLRDAARPVLTAEQTGRAAAPPPPNPAVSSLPLADKVPACGRVTQPALSLIDLVGKPLSGFRSRAPPFLPV